MAFDQWMQFYDHYTVIGSKITVTFMPTDPSTVALGTAIIGIYLGDSPTNLSGAFSVDEMIEQGKTVYTQLASPTPKTLTRKFSTKKFFGTKNVNGQPEYKGTTASNPDDQAYFHVWVGPTSPVWDAGEVRVTIKIDYIAMLTEPKFLAQS